MGGGGGGGWVWEVGKQNFWTACLRHSVSKIFQTIYLTGSVVGYNE